MNLKDAKEALNKVVFYLFGYHQKLKYIEKEPVAKVKGEIESEKARLEGMVDIASTINSIPGLSQKTRKEVFNKIMVRLGHEEIRFQENIDVISDGAYVLLEGKTTVNEEPDFDWYTKFFGIAKEISNEDMQKIWSSILAREIEKPGSVSLRTLDILKNISHKEALLFNNISNFIISCHEEIFIINYQGNGFQEYFTFSDLLSLEEAGLINLNPLVALNFNEIIKGNKGILHFVYQKKVIILTFPKDSVVLNFNIHSLTKSGEELFKLISGFVFSEGFFNFNCNFLKQKYNQATIQTADLNEIDDDGYNLTNLRDFK